MWSLRSPWCSEHKIFLESELLDKISHSIHHLSLKGIIPIQMRKTSYLGKKVLRHAQDKTLFCRKNVASKTVEILQAEGQSLRVKKLWRIASQNVEQINRCARPLD